MIIEKYNKKKNVKYNKKYEKSRERQGEIWSEKVLDIFWPSICPFCGKVNRGGVCPLCRKAVEKLEIHEPRCLKCGKPIRCEEREFAMTAITQNTFMKEGCRCGFINLR